MTRNNAPAFSDYVGIPYNAPDGDGTGLNCWQLVERVMVDMFHVEPPIVHYTGPWEKVAPVFMTQLMGWQWVPFDQRKAGDLLLLSVAGYPVHCGILIDADLFLHTLNKLDSCIESVKSIAWKKRILGVYRWKEAQN